MSTLLTNSLSYNEKKYREIIAVELPLGHSDDIQCNAVRVKSGFWPFLDFFTKQIKNLYKIPNDGASNRHYLY